MHTPGRLHAIVDFLSRLEIGEATEGISDELPDAQIFNGQVESAEGWYEQLLTYLIDGALSNQLTVDQRRKFVLKSKPFLIIAEALYRRGIGQIIRRCVPDEEQSAVMREAHYGDSGGHFSGEIRGKKILQAGLW